jgi:hypothetical protein
MMNTLNFAAMLTPLSGPAAGGLAAIRNCAAGMTHMLRGAAIVALALSTGACTDAATRVAHDIESGTRGLASREGARVEIPHDPRRWPEGCAGSYILRIAKGAAGNLGHNNFRIQPDSGSLSVNCYGSSGNLTGWTTTYHLRFVDVPKAVEIEKKADEVVLIEVEHRSGRAVLVGLH